MLKIFWTSFGEWFNQHLRIGKNVIWSIIQQWTETNYKVYYYLDQIIWLMIELSNDGHIQIHDLSYIKGTKCLFITQPALIEGLCLFYQCIFNGGNTFTL